VTSLVLLRHGETDWNATRRLQGWAPVPLNERGREQAAAAAEHLADEYDVDRVLASDLRRTRETARPVCAAVGREATFESAWRERGVGVYQGLDYEDFLDGYPEFDVEQSGTAAVRARPEGGESVLDLRERVLDRWNALLDASDAEETVLVVTHGGPIYTIFNAVRGRSVVDSFRSGKHQKNCAVNEFHHDSETGAIEVVRRNETGYR
jgi:probable phosphoglycerate mutase